MAERHFHEQRKHTQAYLLSYFQQHIRNFKDLKILEVGCAEGGFLDVLHESGMQSVGIELEAGRVALAKEKNPELEIHVGDITAADITAKVSGPFDLIILRDVIEHIPQREALFRNITKLLNDDGYLYVTFPPRFSPFAGHQQNGRSVLRFVPYLQLLPAVVIRGLGKLFAEHGYLIDYVILNYRVGLTIRAFEKYYTRFGFTPVVKELFLTRPIYKTRHGLTPRRLPNIPVLREVISLGCECLLRKRGCGE